MGCPFTRLDTKIGTGVDAMGEILYTVLLHGHERTDILKASHNPFQDVAKVWLRCRLALRSL